MDRSEMVNKHTTDELVAAYHRQCNVPGRPSYDREELEAAIMAGIDAVYSARDAGLTMHGAGAAAAVAVMDALSLARAVDACIHHRTNKGHDHERRHTAAKEAAET